MLGRASVQWERQGGTQTQARSPGSWGVPAPDVPQLPSWKVAPASWAGPEEGKELGREWIGCEQDEGVPRTSLDPHRVPRSAQPEVGQQGQGRKTEVRVVPLPAPPVPTQPHSHTSSAARGVCVCVRVCA